MLAIVAGYLLGSIPTGYLVAKARGVDIRSVGSGNIGATNVFRILGTPAGVFVLLVDAAKGWGAVLIGQRLLWPWFASSDPALGAEWFAVAGGVAAVLGHNYTLWLRFKGGKGIATSAGVLAGLVPMALLIALVVWVIVFLLSRYVSLASISGAFVLPFAVWYSGYGAAMIIITAVLGALAIYKHRSNIERLMKGTENRIGGKPRNGGERKV
jgi:glycerol-3-phosphate acyltransferase PlsY